MAEKDIVAPEDLLGVSLISAQGEFMESNIGKWFGDYAGKMNIVAKGNLLYNEAMLAESNIGVVIGIRLNYSYDKLKFIPLSPPLETATALAWKKEQIFSALTTAFIEFSRQYLKGISDNKI